MRFLKRLLVCLYAYCGLFFAAALIISAFGVTVPDALIAGVAAATGIESVIGSIIKVQEALCERKRMELEHKLGEDKGEKL